MHIFRCNIACWCEYVHICMHVSFSVCILIGIAYLYGYGHRLIYVFTQPLRTRWMRHKVILIRVSLIWIQSFSSPKAVTISRLKRTVYPTILSISGSRIVIFLPLLRILVQSEMQTASSKIWTRVDMSIFNDTRGYYPTSACMCVDGCVCMVVSKGLIDR